MADKITIDQVNDLLSTLRSDASTDAKVQHVNAIKSGIKQHNVPDNCVVALFEALRVASTSQHAVLVNAGFTGLNHLLTRLSRQEPKFLVKEAARSLPVIIDKLGDQKEKFRSLALQSLVTLYKPAPIDVERFVRNNAMAGKNSRAKEGALTWLTQMHQEQGVQFKPFVPSLMELLEDADGMVRDHAKTTVIELFRNAPGGAKTDLKKQLKNFKIRPAIEQAIVKELIPTSSSAATNQSSTEPAPRPGSSLSMRPKLAASMSAISTERPNTPLPDTARSDAVEPAYVNTQRELEDIFRDMHQWFEGRESEQNWLKREESVKKLRKLIAGNAASDFPDAFITGTRALLDGIIKAITSLRTSLSMEGCSLVQDLATSFGPGIDPLVELLMQTLVKLCAATKKIASQLANVTVETIIAKVTYNTRILQHVWGACQDKNLQPRTYATGWLKMLLGKEAHHKERIEHGGGLDLLEKCIKKGLADANPGVRERMRATYWAYAPMWPARAEALMDALEPTAQKLLQKDPNNPNSPKRVEGGVRPGLGFSKSTMGPPKPSLREAMMAKKKEAMSSKAMPARPGSAMAHFSPVRTTTTTTGSSAATPTASAAPTPAVRHRAEGTVATKASGMSVAPRRPMSRRPEMAARPATAGPYSVRTHDGPSAERTSPEAQRSKAVTPRPIASSPKRTAQRPRPGHAATASESSISSPSKSAAPGKVAPSPRNSPVRLARSAHRRPESNTPTKAVKDEGMTMLIPDSRPHMAASPPGLPQEIPQEALKEIPLPMSPQIDLAPTVLEVQAETPPKPKSLKVYEDPFTGGEAPSRPTFSPPVLEDKPVNEDAGNLRRSSEIQSSAVDGAPPVSPEKSKQNSRLLDSGISKIHAQTLDVHGFRKLQGIIRENKVPFPDEKMDALLLGLFDYLESPLTDLAPEKVQDVKAQILATIKLLLKKSQDNFQPHITRGLEALLSTRSSYDARTHIVSGLELLADELVTLGDASEIVTVLTRKLQSLEMDVKGCRALSMGMHVLKEMVDVRDAFQPSEPELDVLSGLTKRCLESSESGVRMDAVQLCVALHSRIGDRRFWDAMQGVRDDPKSLITYYIVKRQRERGDVAAAA